MPTSRTEPGGWRPLFDGRTTDGYHVFLGADLDRGVVGEVVGRVAEDDVPGVIDALVGVWEATRRPAEPFGTTARRVGLDAISAHLEAVLQERWAAGPEPELAASTDPVAVAIGR